MNSSSSPHNLELPFFRILIVEDDPTFRQQLRLFIEEFGGTYYQLEIREVGTIEEGMELLHAPIDTPGFDSVLLDLNLPRRPGLKPQNDLSLNYLCLEMSKRIRWVAQVTSYPTDPELQRFREKFSSARDFRYAVYSKETNDLLRLARDMFFPEIKEPLASEWLPEELGAVEMPIGRRASNTPEGFNIYKFIHRMHTVWPALDEPTRARALELFEIEPNDTCSTKITRIGFRAFSCWDRSTKN